MLRVYSTPVALVRRGIGADVPAQSELQTFIRTFPSCATPEQFSDALYQAAEFGRKIIAAGPVLSPVNSGNLSSLVQKARDLQTQGLPFHWPWQPAGKLCTGGTLYDERYKTITDIYQESSGVAGGNAVIEQARKQLVDDLEKPLNPNSYWGAFWRAHKVPIITAGAAVAALVLLPYAKPYLNRLRRKPSPAT